MAYTEVVSEAEDGCLVKAMDHVQPNLKRQSSRRARAARLKSMLATMRCDRSHPHLAVASADVIGILECGRTTYFRIRVCPPEASWSWDVLRRYSEFRVLRDALCIGSHFPKKTGPFRCKGNRLFERQQILQAWIQGILTDYSLCSDADQHDWPEHFERKLTILHQFLGIGQDGALVPSVVLTMTAQAACLPACTCQAACTCGPAVQMLASARIACVQKAHWLHTTCHSRDAVAHSSEESDASSSSLQTSGSSRVATSRSTSTITQTGVVVGTFRVDVPHGLPAGKAFEVQAAGTRYAVIVPADHDGLVEFDILDAATAGVTSTCRQTTRAIDEDLHAVDPTGTCA